MERWEAKVVCMAIMYLVIFFCMLLPIKLKKLIEQRENGHVIVSVLRCFAGGIFLGTVLTHMLPEVNFLIKPAFLEPNNIDYPLGEAFVISGFFLVCFFERIVIAIDGWNVTRKAKRKQASRCDVYLDGADCCYDNHNFQGMEMAVTTADKEPEASIPPQSESVEVTGRDLSEVRSLIFYMALSFECIFDGLGVGLQFTAHGTWNMCMAVIAHEFIIAFCIGMELLKYHPPKVIWVASFCYAIIPTIGCSVGMILTEINLDIHQDVLATTSGLLIAIAAGIFLSCTFIGMLGEELIEEGTFPKLFAAITGCGMMAGLALIVPHETAKVAMEHTTTDPFTTPAL
ncbi:hypothetical protein CAPTEDRAFT_186513 [Capitella teleta]|uniref:Zinc/iron permease n=1 Tax=Capitella teleta TaxID=283909 RepID=R7V2Q7_CAPTE|nr:hypothetical protein CAPTEDRAFT_186513 [Capitella teleta]|eukprot:ELU12829.1 hypothetical protein CAPTEDRAFT_186513 [Capitella teleta]